MKQLKVYRSSAVPGKTFTLVKHYLTILLKSESPYAFKDVLAITFTNKTAQEREQQIMNLSQQLDDLKTSNEMASTKTTALAAISNLGAINAEQTLALLQGKLQKNAEGKVVVLNGGVEQDLNNYLSSLKNPGSGWEHHFKPSSAAGMGAKPSPVGNTGGGQVNPWKTGNLTQQMILSEQDPQLAAVLKQEAQK